VPIERSQMTTEQFFLILGADHTARVTKRLPKLRYDETAVRVKVNYPDGWGKISGTVEVTVPDDLPTMEAEVVPARPSDDGVEGAPEEGEEVLVADGDLDP
jgi:hypothetical protein